VVEIFAGSSPIITDSLKIYFGTDTLFGNNSLLTPTGNPNEYMGYISSQGADVVINYYLSVEDSMGIQITSPPGSPSNYYSFYAGQDTVYPTLIHTPITNVNILALPVHITAQSSDYCG